MASALLLAMVDVCVAESSFHLVKRARADRELEQDRRDLVCVTLYQGQDHKRAEQASTPGVVLLCRRCIEPSRRPSRCPSDGTKACQDDAAPSGPAAAAPHRAACGTHRACSGAAGLDSGRASPDMAPRRIRVCERVLRFRLRCDMRATALGGMDRGRRDDRRDARAVVPVPATDRGRGRRALRARSDLLIRRGCNPDRRNDP